MAMTRIEVVGANLKLLVFLSALEIKIKLTRQVRTAEYIQNTSSKRGSLCSLSGMWSLTVFPINNVNKQNQRKQVNISLSEN